MTDLLGACGTVLDQSQDAEPLRLWSIDWMCLWEVQASIAHRRIPSHSSNYVPSQGETLHKDITHELLGRDRREHPAKSSKENDGV